ncbi:hypothetical protein [Streptomyces liangshanensis]|uniref:hypothetical protein n=1 Tax=Streptomyces liangshanensis TaxID=2717324 RepID=UPI0036DF1F30
MQWRDEEQALAVTLALLLLIGGVLVLRELLGVWGAFASAAGVVLAGYYTPWLVRWAIVRRAVRELRRSRL